MSELHTPLTPTQVDDVRKQSAAMPGISAGGELPEEQQDSNSSGGILQVLQKASVASVDVINTPREGCPAAGAKCFACDRVAHLSRCCTAKGKGVYSMLEEEDMPQGFNSMQEEVGAMYLEAVEIGEIKHGRKRWFKRDPYE